MFEYFQVMPWLWQLCCVAMTTQAMCIIGLIPGFGIVSAEDVAIVRERRVEFLSCKREEI